MSDVIRLSREFCIPREGYRRVAPLSSDCVVSTWAPLFCSCPVCQRTCDVFDVSSSNGEGRGHTYMALANKVVSSCLLTKTKISFTRITMLMYYRCIATPAVTSRVADR